MTFHRNPSNSTSKLPFWKGPGSISYPKSLLKCDFRGSVFSHCRVEKKCDSQKKTTPHFSFQNIFKKKNARRNPKFGTTFASTLQTTSPVTMERTESLFPWQLLIWSNFGRVGRVRTKLEIPKRSVGGISQQNRKNAV